MRPALTAPALAMIGAIALLSACGTSDKKPTERRAAAGEVLGGDISDAMLPLDSARSTSPLEPRKAVPENGTTPSQAPKTGATEPVATPGATPAQAAKPAAKPTPDASSAAPAPSATPG